jgi:multiple sugar transport system substrate-binding protein
VREFAGRAAKHGLAVGWPSVPTDLMCTLVSIGASLGHDPGREGAGFLDPAVTRSIIGELKALAQVSHTKSREWNPIRCLDHMAGSDDVAYVPYLFNYVNYSSGKEGHPITFGQAPVVEAGKPARTLLGGAGIGISAKARDPEAAFRYAMYLCAPEYQSGDYVVLGGQPGSRSAWTSDACNALTGNFFRNTLPVLDAAYLRPTHPGFVPLFHDSTLRLAAVVFEDAPIADFAEWLNASYDRIRPKVAAE